MKAAWAGMVPRNSALCSRYRCQNRRHVQPLHRFRLDLMTGLNLLDDTSLRPPGFDTLAHLRSSMPVPLGGDEAELHLHAPSQAVGSLNISWGVTVTALPAGGTWTTALLASLVDPA